MAIDSKAKRQLVLRGYSNIDAASPGGGGDIVLFRRRIEGYEMYLGMRKYGVQAVFDFAVYDIDGVDLDTDWVPAQADCELIKDGGISTMITATAVDEGVTYSITLSATEMQCERGVIKIQDAATKVILDAVFTFSTYGHASAEHALDFDDSVRAGLTALPNAAAAAAGGIPLSTAGSLEMDTIADWLNAGRLDAILDTIAGDVVNIDGIVPEAAGVAPTVAEITADVWDEPTATVRTAGTYGQLFKDNVDAVLSAIEADTQDIQTQVGTAGAGLTNLGGSSNDWNTVVPDAAGVAPTAAEISGAVWDEDATGHQTQGTFGQAIGDPVADTTTIYQAVATDATGDNVAVDINAVKAETALIVADTGELQTDDIPTLIAAIQTVVDKIPLSDGVISWNATALAAINAEVDTALDTTIAELGVAAPTATPTMRTGLMLLYMALRNRVDVNTSGTDSLDLYNDAGTKIAGKLLTDDGSDYSEAEMA